MIAAGLLYGALAFAAGALLGPLRELVLAPRLGAALAALAELPAMALLLWLAARHAVARLPAAPPRARAGVAATGLAVVVACELALGAALEASGLAAGRAPRDATLRLVGLALLAWLAAMPFLVHRRAVAA
jgi:hypothetical protein